MKTFMSLINNLNKITFSPLFCFKRKKNKKLLVCFPPLFVFFVLVSTDPAFSEKLTQTQMTVKGRIILQSVDLIPEEGLNVVLLKLVLDAEGEITPLGPQGRVKTDKNGHFEFLRINSDYRAGYQLGTRVDGKLYSSKVFFLKAGEEQVEKDIIIPGVIKDLNKLEISKVSLVIESGLSSVTVTEVLSFYNSSSDRINTRNLSLKLALPKGYYNFTMIQSISGTEIEHQIDDSILVIKHLFPPGNTQIIFYYNLGAWYGSLNIQREFNHSLDKVSVLTPSGQLEIESAQLNFSGKQQVHETDFLVWKGKASDSNKLKFKISNVPVHSLKYIGISGIILFLLILSSIMFIRNRLMIRDRN